MKKISLYLASLVLVGGLVACGGGKSENTLNATDSAAVASADLSQAYVSDSTSVLNWKGFKPAGSHNGTLQIADAKVEIQGKSLIGGYVEIDMNTLKVLDLEGEMAEKLRGHLLSEDFFEAQTYSTAKFELSDIPEGGLNLDEAKELKGNLTLKAKTKNITIPVKSVQHNEAEGTFVIESDVFRINRADWDVKYGSKSFFTGLGDNFIDDEMELSFTLKLKK